MTAISLNKATVTPFLISLLLLLFVFSNSVVRAEIDTLLLDEKNIAVNHEFDNQNHGSSDKEDFDYERFRSADDSGSPTTNKKIKFRRNPLVFSDSTFSNQEGLTLKSLIMKVSLIVLVLLGILFFLKLFLSRYKFDKPGNILDNLTQKFHDTFSPSSGLKLKQTLMLTPGQNLYVVEIDEKKLLIGGTHQGGVQFLADLTQGRVSENLEFKKVEEYQNQVKQFIGVNSKEPMKHVGIPIKSIENPFVALNQNLMNTNNEINNNALNQQVVSEEKETPAMLTQMKQPLKRRTNFRQTLLSNVK